MVFDSISSNIEEVFTINPSANVLFLGDFHIHHTDWLTYSGGTDCPDELCYNFSISNNRTQTVNFPTQIPVTITVLPFLISFFLLMLVFFLQWLFLNWEILILLLPQFP